MEASSALYRHGWGRWGWSSRFYTHTHRPRAQGIRLSSCPSLLPSPATAAGHIRDPQAASQRAGPCYTHPYTLSQIRHVDTNSRPHTQRHTPICAWTHMQSPLTHIHTNNRVHKLAPRVEPHLQGDARCHTQRHARNAEGRSPAQRRPPTHKLQTQVNSIMTTSEIPAPFPHVHSVVHSTKISWAPTMCQVLF